MSGSESGTDTQTTTQTSEPWAPQQDYLKTGFVAANDLLNQGEQSYFPYQTYANFNPLQTMGQDAAMGYAVDQLQPYMNQIMDQNQLVAGGGLMNADSNPYLASYAQAAAAPIQQNLMEQALPMIRNQAIGAGQYGGSRQDLSEGLAVGRAADAIGNVTSNIYSNAYGQNLGAMMQAQGMAPMLGQAGMMPSNIMNQVGSQQQMMDQLGIDEDMARYFFEQNAPQQLLQDYMQNISGTYGTDATGTVSNPYETNPLTSALGGGLTGASLASMMYSGTGTNPYMLPFVLGGSALGYF